MKIRIFILMFIAIAVQLVNESVSAASVTIKNITYTVMDNGTVCAEAALTSSENVEIPESVEIKGRQYSVTEIGENLFSFSTSLASIKLPEGVKVIRKNAFADCKQLKSVIMPESLEVIGAEAFRNCKNLMEITIPVNVELIGENAFQNCTGLTTVNFNAEGKVIMGTPGQTVFNRCMALGNVVFGENITCIPANAFKGCNAITSIKSSR